MNLTTLLIIGGIVIIGYVLFRILTRPDTEFQRQYNEILNSSKYKVKGQFEER